MNLEEIKNNTVITNAMAQIREDYLSVFPNGFIAVDVRKSIGNPYLSITLGLIGGDDVANNIRENDPLHTSLMGHDISDVEKFTLKTLQSGLICEPEEGSYMAMSRVKTSKRKTNNTLDKQVVGLKKYFKTLGKIVKENQDNIYRLDRIPAKYLEINNLI